MDILEMLGGVYLDTLYHFIPTSVAEFLVLASVFLFCTAAIPLVIFGFRKGR